MIKGNSRLENRDCFLVFPPRPQIQPELIRLERLKRVSGRLLSDGSKGRQITSFKSDFIRDFRWSPDGKHLAVLHFHSTADVILLHDTIAPQQ